jgi:aspartyl protease family protein
MADFPRWLKPVTAWLLLGTVLFLGIQAWQAQERRTRFTVDGTAIEIRRSPDGHFHWPGRVNGRTVDFLVDTGATRTALPPQLADGLPRLGRVGAQTAGGVVEAEVVRIELQLDGGVTAEQLPVMVLPDLKTPLLGMDVLGRLRFSQEPGVLRVVAP